MITIQSNSNHIVESEEVNGVIHFKCTHCDYHRIMDKTTGSTKLETPGDEEVQHSGTWEGPIVQEFDATQN